jgi:acarbose 7IV-phosphotransferase
MQPSCDVLVVGGSGIDTIVRVPELPFPFADSIFVEPIRDYVAHTGNGVALGCHALGLRTSFVDAIGDDPQGALIRERYQIEGLDFHPHISAAGTARAVNLVDRHGRRMSLYDGRHPADLVLPPALYQPLLDSVRHVHLSIMNFAKALIPELLDRGLPFSTDLHDWDGVNPYHRDFGYAADLVQLSATALGDRVPAVVDDLLTRGRAQVVVVTAGAEGAWVRERGAALTHVPAVSPWPVVDSNGAGDSFLAGFLFGYLAGQPVTEAAQLGAIAGAYACASAGTHADFITAAQLAAARDGIAA